MLKRYAMLAVVAVISGLSLWWVIANHPVGPDNTATYTWWLTICTALLGVATAILAALAILQFGDSRLNNRAYITVEPLGLSPWRGSANSFLGHVNVVNVGLLPARNLKWAFEIAMTNDGDRELFPEPIDLRGPQLVAGHSSMKRGSVPIERAAQDYCFVWGVITYDDGYHNSRKTTFCHRYNCDRDDFRATRIVPEGDARQHEFGNGAD
jgi:hypothetical protein